MIRTTSLALLLLAGASSVSATLVDFNGIATGLQGSTLNLTVDGVTVTFSGIALTIADVSGERVLHSGDFQDPIAVTFSGGFTAAFVEVENHFFVADVVMGEAFNALDISLDSGATTTTNGILRLNGPGIAKVVYDDTTTGYALDNFTFSAVPEPSSFLFLAVSLGMFRLVRLSSRRRSIA